MLTDLQRLDAAEAMQNMTDAERTEFLAAGNVTETTDIDVINQLIVDLADNAAAEAEIGKPLTAEAEVVCEAVETEPVVEA